MAKIKLLELKIIAVLYLSIFLSGVAVNAWAKPLKVQMAQWTFMVYLDADNNLDPYGHMNLLQMSEGLKDDAKINVVVLMDRLHMPAYVYRISHMSIEIVESVGEVDMGSPDTLASFVTYAMKNYASEYYLLDIWDHGGGYFGVCWDESSCSHLSPHDIETALEQAERETNKHINIVGFDACLMGMIEVCYELKDVTDIVIGSEMLIPGYGWPYKSLMQYLSMNSNVEPYTLSREVVTHYVSFYENLQPTFFVQMSAINESYVTEMSKSLNALADHLSRNIIACKDLISNARSTSQ